MADGGLEVDWRNTAPTSGRVVADTVVVISPEGGRRFELTSIEQPAVEPPGYVVSGRVRYAGVEGQGYLEMWSIFPNGGRSFSRTVASHGPEAALSGDSGWREFRLPFALEGMAAPLRLEINVVLPGAGRVWVGPLRLEGMEETSSWWSDRTGGIVGGVMGAVIGLLGAAIGSLVSRRRARRFVMGAIVVGTALGIVALGGGFAAVVASQPYGVYYPLLLGGVILTLVFSLCGRAARRAYAQAELRKMRALDLG